MALRRRLGWLPAIDSVFAQPRPHVPELANDETFTPKVSASESIPVIPREGKIIPFPGNYVTRLTLRPRFRCIVIIDAQFADE
jgi:hypothetical protein